MRRLIVCALFALFAGLVGPRVVGPQARSSGTSFVYEPPAGFVQAKDAKSEAEGAQVWVFDEPNDEGAPLAERRPSGSTRIILTHSSKSMSVEESDLAKLSEEMPKAFEGLCSWVHRRHEMRVRTDGARVGLIDGDCDGALNLGQFGLPSQTIKTRKLQLMFPDDTGTWIATASYPAEQASRWEPQLEATIATARGVAVRVPAPPAWTHLAWAAAGAALGWLATAIAARRGVPGPAAAPPRANGTKLEPEDDDEDEGDEEDS